VDSPLYEVVTLSQYDMHPPYGRRRILIAVSKQNMKTKVG